MKGTPKKKKSVPVPVATPPLSPALDLESWRKSEVRVEAMRGLMAEPWFQDAMCVMVNSIPSGYPRPGERAKAVQVAVAHGRTQGFIGAIQVLRAMAVPIAVRTEVDATYLTDEQEAALASQKETA